MGAMAKLPIKRIVASDIYEARHIARVLYPNQEIEVVENEPASFQDVRLFFDKLRARSQTLKPRKKT